ncbi:MAG: relaxase/mobilization nuclease domain-containing protein [Lachnospiraceae bacterium]|nr:relaxase/mobilization nuclease domain-containing protein [Lachnospiraceae bacterium]
MSVHQDRDHLHCHIVTNSVSYIDGIKLHQTKKDLQAQKDFTNSLCRERGLSVTEKGFHFDGTRISFGHLSAWSKDKYFIKNSVYKTILIIPPISGALFFLLCLSSLSSSTCLGINFFNTFSSSAKISFSGL